MYDLGCWDYLILLEFTPLEFETFFISPFDFAIELEFTPLEFETR